VSTAVTVLALCIACVGVYALLAYGRSPSPLPDFAGSQGQLLVPAKRVSAAMCGGRFQASIVGGFECPPRGFGSPLPCAMQSRRTASSDRLMTPLSVCEGRGVCVK
jgi:hypothetical protein